MVMECVDLASRAPSAGRAQGWRLLVWQGEEVKRYWDVALPESKRSSFAFPHLLDAPVLMLSMVDTGAYLDRYSEQDKSGTGLGDSLDGWPAPYWTIDASFATMTLLLALHDRDLGTLFFAHANEPELRREFSISPDLQILGVIAVGHPRSDGGPKGRSASRPRLGADRIVRINRWS